MTTRIAVNEDILTRGISGSARVTGYLVDALQGIEGAEVRGVRPSRVRSRSKVLNAVGDARWDLYGASRAARGADLLVSPCNIGRAWGGQRHLLMVYDVMVWEARDHFDPAFAAYARTLIPLSMRNADLVLTISEHAREVLASLVPSATIRVIHPPAPDRHAPRVRFPGGRPTVVVLGETAPHKNQVAAIEAVRLARETSGIDIELRLIGPPGRAEASVGERLRLADPGSTWTRRESGLPDAELDAALGSAWVLLQPSLHEGYGLPLVEAAQRGLPVLHSGREGMIDVLPASSVESVDPPAYCERLVTLLEATRWQVESDTVFERSSLFSTAAFSSAVRDSVALVLPASTPSSPGTPG